MTTTINTNCEICKQKCVDEKIYRHRFCYECAIPLVNLCTKVCEKISQEFVDNRYHDMPITLTKRSSIGISKTRLWPEVLSEENVTDIYTITVKI